MPEDTIRKAIGIYHTGQYSIKEIEHLTGVKKSTLYRYLEGEKGESALQNGRNIFLKESE